MTNIEDFNEAAEQAKIEFQGNIASLLEMHGELSARLYKAQEKGKDGVYLLNGELEIFNKWLLQSCTALLENYALIDRTLRKTNVLYKAAARIHFKDMAA